MKIGYACLLWFATTLCACASEQQRSFDRINRMLDDACPHWAMTVVAPGRMEAYVEEALVKDDRGRWIDAYGGMAGDMAQPEGWPALDSIGDGGSAINSAGAPMEVALRWQSLAEPQTYTWRFTIPESMRQAMAEKEPVDWLGKATLGCRSTITIGVAPGGRTVVWIGGNGTHTIEVMHGQADVEPLGPYQGTSHNKYRPMHEPARTYIEAHGIPYKSWEPPASTPVVTNAQYKPAELPKVDIAAHPEGTYVLVDVMETGSALRLLADGTFEATVEIGGAYGQAAGRWVLKGNTMTLKRTSTKRGDLATLFDNRQLTIDGRCLRTAMMGTDACYLRQ